MAKSKRERAENAFAKYQKPPQMELKQQEKDRLARAEKTARLRALRLARDTPADDVADAPSPTMPKAHRHA